MMLSQISLCERFAAVLTVLTLRSVEAVRTVAGVGPNTGAAVQTDGRAERCGARTAAFTAVTLFTLT